MFFIYTNAENFFDIESVQFNQIKTKDILSIGCVEFNIP